MKQTLLLLVLALGMCSINVSAQNKKTVRRTTTTQTKQKVYTVPKKSRDYQIGVDGYEWYKIYKNGKYGVEDRNGNTIVPAEYDGVRYDAGCYDCVGYSPVTAGFDVRKGEYWGWYNKSGKCIIPYTRGYNYIRKYDTKEEGTYYMFIKSGGGGFCDMHGKVVVTVDFEGLSHIEVMRTFDERLDKQLQYLEFEVKNLWGIADANGKIVATPFYEMNGHQDTNEINNLSFGSKSILQN